MSRPAKTEYATYFGTYIDKVGDGDILDILARQIDQTVATLSQVSEPDAEYRYAPGKWSLKEIVGHMSDTERIFVYRAVCFARGDQQPLPGFDENTYVTNASFDDRTLADHLAEFKAVRAASLFFLKGLNADELMRTGTANKNPYTVRAIPYILAGHEKHHMGVVKERYLKR